MINEAKYIKPTYPFITNIYIAQTSFILNEKLLLYIKFRKRILFYIIAFSYILPCVYTNLNVNNIQISFHLQNYSKHIYECVGIEFRAHRLRLLVNGRQVTIFDPVQPLRRHAHQVTPLRLRQSPTYGQGKFSIYSVQFTLRC